MNVYCDERKLPPPTENDYSACGAWISREFRSWVFNEGFRPGDVIPHTGLIVQQEGEKSYVVAFYPGDFKLEMVKVVTRYFHFKNEPKKPAKPAEKSPPQTTKKQRKRIPLNAEKVGSSGTGHLKGHH